MLNEKQKIIIADLYVQYKDKLRAVAIGKINNQPCLTIPYEENPNNRK